MLTPASYSEVSDTALVAEDFCKHLGLIFSVLEQVWSSRLLQVKDVQSASQWISPTSVRRSTREIGYVPAQHETETAAQLFWNHRGLGWACKFTHADSLTSLKGLLQPQGIKVHGLYSFKCTSLWCDSSHWRRWPWPRQIWRATQTWRVQERYGNSRYLHTRHEWDPCVHLITCIQGTRIQTGRVKRKGSSRMSGNGKPVVWAETSFFHFLII